IVKIAAADRDRVGTLEVPVHAALASAGPVTLTALIAGGAVPPGDLSHPTIGSRVTSGSLHGYLEVYGSNLEGVQVRFEIAVDDSAPALLGSSMVAMRRAGNDRALFSQMMPVQLLPPGFYRLRAVVGPGVGASGAPATTLTRGFEVSGLPNESTPTGLYLPVERGALARPFSRTDALNATTL